MGRLSTTKCTYLPTSREFVLEGHRVSCLVPTSGGSGQGVDFGVFEANISLG